jgi:hypothetical protein
MELLDKVVGNADYCTNREQNDNFGNVVSISGETLVVGVPSQSYDALGENSLSNAGAVYVFTRNGGNWIQEQKLVGSGVNGRMASDYFGYSVGIFSETLVVGAYGHDYDSNGSYLVSFSGAAYVFTRNGGIWSLEQKLSASGANSRFANDQFGFSVGIYGDTVVIGANSHDYDSNGSTSLNNAGAAYVFTRNGGVWSLEQKLSGSGSNGRMASDYFGGAVYIYGDTAIVGAHWHPFDSNGSVSVVRTGAAYVFTRNGGVWSLEQKLSASGANTRKNQDQFGVSVGLYGDTAIVGANSQDYDSEGGSEGFDTGAAFIFTRSGGLWSQQQRLVGVGVNGRKNSDYFGSHVKIYGDTVIVGANQAYDESGGVSLANAGAGYVFTRSGTVWSLEQKLVGSGVNGRFGDDYFGCDIGIYSETVVVGAYGQSYDGSGSNYQLGAGAGYVYTRSGGVWGLEDKISASGSLFRRESSNFGISASIYNDTLVVGCKGDTTNTDEGGIIYSGAAYVFTRNGNVWELEQKLAPSGLNSRNSGDEFGGLISIHGDTILVSSIYQDYDGLGGNLVSDAGAVYVFTRNGTVWSQQQKLVASGVNGRRSSDYFGCATGVYSNTAVVGAWANDYDANGSTAATNAGAAFIFTRDGTVWSQQQKLVGVGTNGRFSNDIFGGYVSIYGETVVIGAHQQAFDGDGANSLYNAGAVYVFTRSGTVWELQQKLSASGANGRKSSDKFGESVSIYGDAIVVGVQQQDFNENGSNSVSAAGAVYIFTRDGGIWSQQQKLVASGVNGRTLAYQFGNSVSIHQDKLIVGAKYQPYDENGSNSVHLAGAAYIFTRDGGIWSQQQKLVASGVNGRIDSDIFGNCVGIYSETVVVGAYQQDFDGNGSNFSTDSGAVYILGTQTVFSPSESPSVSPSESPSVSPSESPSVSPSESPSVSPSESPSVSPSESPSVSPSESPSVSPSESPSVSPSESPSVSPSISPSESPSVSPSVSPSISPSISPSLSPSTSPSESPSISLSVSPSVSPSVSLSASPSASPSFSNVSEHFIGSGQLVTWGFGEYQLFVGSKFVSGMTVYCRRDALRGGFEKIRIKHTRGVYKGDKRSTLYIDTLNWVWEESELVSYLEAVSLVEAYWEWELLNPARSENKFLIGELVYSKREAERGKLRRVRIRSVHFGEDGVSYVDRGGYLWLEEELLPYGLAFILMDRSKKAL